MTVIWEGLHFSRRGLKARVADAHSRDIFFVSMARSMAIPARINGVTGKVQLIGDDGVTDVDLNHHPEEPVFMAEGIASKES